MKTWNTRFRALERDPFTADYLFRHSQCFLRFRSNVSLVLSKLRRSRADKNGVDGHSSRATPGRDHGIFTRQRAYSPPIRFRRLSLVHCNCPITYFVRTVSVDYTSFSSLLSSILCRGGNFLNFQMAQLLYILGILADTFLQTIRNILLFPRGRRYYL